ncbi:MAG: hypothetical protein IT442_14700 [Phycisphaeraceae bacterium]|nr:hypothetical protein [Phycisphaeraceae bacterium]
MRRSLENRDIEFRATPGGMLERYVKLPDGREYAHRCSEDVFKEVAAHIDEHLDQGVTMTALADVIDAPYTQVNVALELLKERGMFTTQGRINYVERGYRTAFYEHALTEFYAIIEGCPPEQRAVGDGPEGS